MRFIDVATNRRSTGVAWDLWPNTRVRPEGWPFVRLAPGESMRFEQTAEVIDYVGKSEPESHVPFLESLQMSVESKPLLR